MNGFEATIKLLENSHFYYVIIAGMDGNYAYVNAHYRDEFGIHKAEIIGKPYDVTMHPDDRSVCAEVAALCFQNPAKSFPATIRKHDGKGGYIITQWEYRAMFDDQNQPAGVFCMGYNITDYVRANENLEFAKSKIQEKNSVLERIGWEQSHIIRRPVANIIGLVGILHKMELDQNTTNICEMLTESAVQLDNAIKKIIEQVN